MPISPCLDDLFHNQGASMVQHLVKSEDLNHHRTLYAGRLAEWFVEAGFIAAANLLPPERIVCLKVHGLEFLHPVYAGEIASFAGRVVYTGRSSVVSYVHMEAARKPIVSGFITFIHVDENGKALPHGLNVQPANEEECQLYEQARKLQERA